MANYNKYDIDFIKKNYPKLYNAIFGNGEEIGMQLQIASLFIMSFECLKDYVEDSFRDFFSEGYKRNKHGELIPKQGKKFTEIKQKYEQKYKQLAKRLLDYEPKKVTTFQTGCAWFHDMEAIDDDDLVLIMSSSLMRNDFAHKLYRWIIDDGYPYLDQHHVYAPINLLFQISNWWVRNIEAGIAPEDYEKFSEEDMKSAASMNALFLHLILKNVLPENSENP